MPYNYNIYSVLVLSFFFLHPFFSLAQSADQLIRVNNVANTAAMENISNPYEGSLVYVENRKTLFLYNGDQWNAVWGSQGNIASDSCFIGTNNNQDLGIHTNNQQQMVVKNNGRVGVNLTNPIGIFQVNAGNSDDFIVTTIGNVGIGINPNPTQKLHVDGNILATGTITPDYVFEKYYNGESKLNPDYQFNSLENTEKFIKENKHLPGVPSAKKVEEQGGIILNRATEINLEKIEELYLHIFEFNQRIKKLQECQCKE